MARAVVASRMAPHGLETPEACLIAILHGLEVGLTPLSALQRIAVIDGRPTIWGDGAMALVRASGLCRSIARGSRATRRRTGSRTCTVQRRGESDPVDRRFGVEDARRAGLWGRPGPWSQYPHRMLQMRARAFALRDVFADVLGGLYLREEIESEVVLSYPAPSAPIPPALACPGPTCPAHRRCAGREQNARGPTAAHPGLAEPGTAVEPPGSLPGHEPEPASALPSRRAGPPMRRALRKRQQGWARLRAPREAIRLRAPPPPEFAHLDGAEPTRRQCPRRAGGRLHGVPFSPADTLMLLDDALACALDPASLAEVEDEFAARLAALPREHLADAERIKVRHDERVDALPHAIPGNRA